MATGKNLLFVGIFAAALGSGLIGGIFFAFSVFIMKALAGLAPDKGMAAMQAINVVILNPLFLTVFMGTAVICLPLAIYAIKNWNAPGATYLLLGSLLYLVGCIVITAVFNVPRNDALAAADPNSPNGVAVWKDYVVVWTNWNHVRTVATLLGSALLILALLKFRSPVSEN